MKLFRRSAFLELPAGIFYSKGKPWAFRDLCVKNDTIYSDDGKAIDWYYRSFNWIAGSGSDDFRQLQLMLETGCSVDMIDALERDGCFDDEEVFLVLEAADIARVYSAAGRAIAITPENF